MFKKYNKRDIIVFFGKTGVGKTSTINRLFNLKWKTDNAVACTQALSFAEHQISSSRKMLIVDIPGIAESQLADDRFLPQYIQACSNAGHIVWIFQGDTRVYRPDQVFLLKLRAHINKQAFFTFGLNQIDRIGTGDWNRKKNEPSPKQIQYIKEKQKDIHEKFSKYLPALRIDDIVPYSATTGFNTKKLYQKITS